jgi:acyl-CoA thioester hydrolase
VGNSDTSFVWPVRVYYEDTDTAGVVYYANYLKFMERARTEWLRHLGFEQDRLMREGVVFAVRSVQVDYRRPAVFNDALEIVSSVEDLGKASITFDQRVRRTGESDVLCQGLVKIACLSLPQLRPTSIPSSIREAVERVR